SLDRSVGIGLRVVGQKLASVQSAVRIAADHIRERAAAIDPEIPFAGHECSPPLHMTTNCVREPYCPRPCCCFLFFRSYTKSSPCRSGCESGNSSPAFPTRRL